ncbi:DUF4870 domain-containing protein [Hymenobacter sp. HMF4947]|uniref:DUF4870 domain-containing protein n=1 Tax=Hymenobacter ginkgonis TaxID=2682976 RepID=A0A7K1THD1_9BACT|nr:helix-turn-helix domain-containing protein [Hymenobacter ginkgonis]MVN77809.1 DUF4870 domain-containing protein [Hymenobacter ginkgonis]
MNKELVARNLLHQRTSRGLTQEQLAEQAGVTARTIQRVEAAAGTPQLTTLALLASALGISVQELAQAPVADTPSRPAAKDNGTLALLHLLPLLGLVVPFAHVLAPLFFWLYARPLDVRLDTQGRAVVNFQVAMTLGIGLGVGLLVLCFPVGALLLLGCYGLVLGMSLVNARRALRNQPVHYPLALPVLRTATGEVDS